MTGHKGRPREGLGTEEGFLEVGAPEQSLEGWVSF